MGREQRRKEQFKNKNKKIVQEELDTSIKWETAIKLVCFTIILLFVVYYVLAVFVTKELDISNGNSNDKKTTEENSSTTDNKILASNIFKQKEEEYYVYFYDFNDEDELAANAIMGIADIVYRVDTSSGLNSKYVTEEDGNSDATNLDELKVTNPTVIKIEADEIVEYYEGSSEISKGLNK